MRSYLSCFSLKEVEEEEGGEVGMEVGEGEEDGEVVVVEEEGDGRNFKKIKEETKKNDRKKVLGG